MSSLEATCRLASRFWFLISFSSERNQGSLEKSRILGLGQGKYKMSQEILWESMKVLKDKMMGICESDTGVNVKNS